ncbi:SipW-dependent-type signal peptide-containing protein [Nocardiopsis ansamitocini]|uniref:Ribosomally synthesized peptide with SipW-like signal peptide n=1 Tax=Nocardiopsis ansamitocini TaxID=1670832 RepID=A0A9W6P4X7_9ACTN|nr:SipW-dependent-type signal peptide-containing protein [Nocardiopsis ansamitocini]GLU47137.1 hypothetical protein Nans01_14880 [Nocardiopsis ansamitocini]
MRLKKPTLVAISAVAAAAALCGIILGTQASFTAQTSGSPQPVTAGRLSVELSTSPGGGDTITIDFTEADPGDVWPRNGAFALTLTNTGDLDGTLTRLESIEVSDTGTPPLSRTLEIASSTRAAQDWNDPVLTWRRIATGAEPSGRPIPTDRLALPAGQDRVLYLKVRLADAGDDRDHTESSTGFRLKVTVEQQV